MSMLYKNIGDSEAIIHQLRQKVYELETDLEHAILQCQKIAAQKSLNINAWINREEPKLER